MDTEKELAFRSQKIWRLVWDYSLPSIVGTLVTALYNVVDRIFIGQVEGAFAISGLAITFPVMTLTSSLGMLVGSGAAARISISLGKRDHHTAEQILGNSLLLTVILNAIFITLFYIYLEPILMAFGASSLTYPYARDYLEIVLLGNVFVSLCYNFNAMMRSSGYPTKAMVTMLIGAVLNLILSPLFLFVFKLGIRGVAWATVISMFIGMLFVMHHFTLRSSVIRLRWRNIRLKGRIILSIITIGLSPFSMQVAASAVALLMNTSLLRYGGDLAVGAYGIVNSILMLVLMVVLGLNQGTQPIIGYNYGAGNYHRVRETLFYALRMATLFTTAGFILGQFFPQLLASAFTTDEELLEISSTGLRIAMLALPLVGFQIVSSNFFQSIGFAVKSIIQSLSRQLIFMVPGIILLPRIWGLKGLWIAIPVSDTLAAMLSLYLLVIQLRHLKQMEQDQLKIDLRHD
ncbi:MAG: MATE family efflux transporter [Proteiniphilum sp.]|nr:MATE family efflux transporter [Proteiniphilum sp.]HHT34550.1 MATE family efflux transporter [Bacteroidales bacterium]MDD2725745.1 MATE family efflux transporter [Proteiniphilum sp.]MDD3555686.1 MATE family efflux transporter [Proteiniphilum sp.]MDD3979669.1 MATE family efflux transporter [Proteiniphilum sp.]